MKKILVLVLLLAVSVISAQSKVYKEQDVSSAPYFPGGWNYYIDFVQKNFKWVPQKDQNKHISLSFTVQKNGSITDVQLVNPLGTPNDKEALRVIAKSPKWVPALIKGKAVACHIIRTMFNPYEDDEMGGDRGLTIEPPRESTATSEIEDDNTIYHIAGVEVKPDFPGGMQKFYEFFKKHFIMPDEEELNGKVFASFIIEKDGSLSNIKIIRDMGFGVGHEVLRVLKGCPKWIPGKQNSKTVRVQNTMPFAIVSTPKTVPEKN